MVALPVVERLDVPEHGGLKLEPRWPAAAVDERFLEGWRRTSRRGRSSELKLKFVAHAESATRADADVGEVAVQDIKRRRKLIGIDVIFVHRLLKNPVRVSEYVLLSEELYWSSGMFSPDQLVHEISQDLEGIGPVRTYCVEVEDLAGPHAPVPDPSSLRCVGEIVGMLGRELRYKLRPGRPVIPLRFTDTSAALACSKPAQSASLRAGRRSASALSLAATTSSPAAELAGYPVTAVRNVLRWRTLARIVASGDARTVAVRSWSRNRAISPKQSPCPSIAMMRPSRTTSA